MSEGLPINEPSLEIKSQKEIIWDNARQEINEIGDRLGLGIDEGIKETVTAFMVNGFPTSSSCEGHADRALPVPWIEVRATNEPEERFVGQNEAFERVAKRYGLSLEDVKFGKNIDAYWDAMKECSKEETEEYKKWQEENDKLQMRAQKLLEDFYEGRKVEPDIKLKTHKYVGDFRIHNGGKDYEDLIGHDEEVSEERIKKRAEKLAKYKKEMDEFTDFLKKKFFEVE